MRHRRLAAYVIAALAVGITLIPTDAAIRPAAAAGGELGGSIAAPTSGSGTESDPYIAKATATPPRADLYTDAVREADGTLSVAADNCGTNNADAFSASFSVLGYPAPTQLTWIPRYPGQADDGCTDGTYKAHLVTGVSSEPITIRSDNFIVKRYGVTPGTYLLSFSPKADYTVTYRHRRNATSKATKDSVFYNKAGHAIYRGEGTKMPAKKRAKVKSWSTTVTFEDYKNQPVTWTRRLGKRMVTSTVKTNSAGVATFKFTKNVGTYAGFQAVTRHVIFSQRLHGPVARFTAPGEANHYEAFQYVFGPMSP